MSKKIDVTQIPRVMRTNNWHIGADLLENWFSRSANSDSYAGTPDTTTLKMDDWVLKFPRAKRVYDNMFAQKIWLNEKAQPVIIKMLKEKGKLGYERVSYGDFSLAVPEIDEDYIQYRRVGSVFWDPTDDLFAALGRLTLRMAIKGFVTPMPKGSHAIHIEEVGVYVRDSYDFNGLQHLGYWDIDKNYGGRNFFKGTKVKNADFREWRNRQGKGGDYIVYSDLKVTQLANGGDVFQTLA
jgi:hypothetical protein